jgi:uncharacterized protein (DUF1015 family)
MPRFEPFAAVRYTDAAGDPADLVAPPYDVIGADDRAALEARSEHNAVRLELPTDGHAGAAERFRAWLQDGTLRRDPAPAFYVYRMTAGATRTTGVLGALTLEAPGQGILPHERTTTKDKADRLGILTETQVNLSPIWGLSASGGRLAAAVDPSDLPLLARALDDTEEGGVVHELWLLDDPDRIAEVAAAVAAQPVLIADGHHRFEVANAYREGADPAPGAGAILAYLVELAEDELAVHPIHRLLTGVPADLDLPAALATWFTVTRAEVADAEALRSAMDDAATLGLVLPDGFWLLEPLASTIEAQEADLDSCRLDVAIAGLAAAGTDIALRFQHGAGIVADRVAKGEADAAVLLRPATVAQIEATGHGGERMPPKTTFFWPKPRTGLVFRDLSA